MPLIVKFCASSFRAVAINSIITNTLLIFFQYSDMSYTLKVCRLPTNNHAKYDGSLLTKRIYAKLSDIFHSVKAKDKKLSNRLKKPC